MDNVFSPFRFREISENKTLLVNEVGDFDFFESDVVRKILSGHLSDEQAKKLSDLKILLSGEDDWRFTALASRARQNIGKRADRLSYMLIVPTLRCDLACSYCQVSRASENAVGFDLEEQQIELLETFWSQHASNSVKIEFQGGEPTLRPDLLNEIITRAEKHFDQVEFAICTNLMNLTPEVEELLSNPKMHISTSIDGPTNLMALNRTGTTESAQKFFENLTYIMRKYGSDKVSALPTIPTQAYDQIEEIIDFYRELGLSSIFLRPVNYMGFARKKHATSLEGTENWNQAYFRALQKIMEINKTEFFEEFYASMIFQKILGASGINYVDCRSPNRYFEDYCVIDYDGSIYPTDEARMLSRTKQVDLKIGEIGGKIDEDKLSTLNMNSINEVHSDCVHCAYGPFCGVDLVDDLSRYGRIDTPKTSTAFCKRHMGLFDLIFEKIAEQDREWLDPLMTWAFRKNGAHAPFEALYD
ncbi:His-Xaa-Ser system radical SAM maturase HxsB [Sulfitobacter sp. JL08]|uniref:His-Xaa-Ser system radical SAM maturase HxsB n=1 Tax=Sulfitobacter sp. JL08 TaxID=2070369 RepID=UPI000E0B2AB5|nr:His-Xaa-Ser system radical SAM maturase HxsB [Sulfitobacter sp. JL08]AXI54786.1 His-Xaa-Ser system radical SAM maturase HxsB [Sulfitobacter sp. JL08]